MSLNKETKPDQTKPISTCLCRRDDIRSTEDRVHETQSHKM